MYSIKKQAATGVKWSALSVILGTILHFVKLSVLGHLLKPEDFGLMALVLMVISLAQAFMDLGMSNAIIHRQNVTHEELSSLYWLNILAGFIIFIIIVAFSQIIGEFFNQPTLPFLMICASLICLITPIGQQFQILMQKELEFERLAKIEVLALIVNFIISILSAICGYGVLALIWGQLSQSICRSALFACLSWNKWHPELHYQYNDVKKYLSFGIYQMGEKSINYLSANIDYVIIGKFLDPHALGAYTLAYQIVMIPLTKINPILTKVAFPVFAKKQIDNKALQRGYLEMIKIIAIISFPLLVTLAISSPVFVPLAFGAQWESTVRLIQILSICGIMKTLGNPTGSILLAKGKADVGFKMNLIIFILNFIVFMIVAPYGVYAIAYSYSLLSLIYFGLGYHVIKKLIQLNLGTYFNSLKKILILNTALIIFDYYLLSYLTEILGMHKILLMFIFSMLSLGIYATLYIFVDMQYVKKIATVYFNKN